LIDVKIFSIKLTVAHLWCQAVFILCSIWIIFCSRRRKNCSKIILYL